MGAGLGRMPYMPGTFGTLAGIPIFWALSHLPVWGYGLAVAALFCAAAWVSGQADVYLGRHDHPGIVIDEVAGFLVTMLGLPATWLNIILGFVLFRVFDILKPWPCRLIDREWQGGWGVVLDDLAAGIFSGLVLQIGLNLWIRYLIFDWAS